MGRGVLFVLNDPAELCAAYRNGASGTELAATLGISKHTVYRLLKAHGVSVRPSGRERRRLDVEDIQARYAEGWTVTALAKRHQCYRPTIRRLLRLDLPSGPMGDQAAAPGRPTLAHQRA